MIDKIGQVKNPFKQRTTLYEIADELGIVYKQNKCPKCAKDLYNICREELGLIEDAAEQSDFNTATDNVEYRYLKEKGTYWNGKRYSQDTPVEMIKIFIKHFPEGFYEIVNKPQQEDINNNE